MEKKNDWLLTIFKEKITRTLTRNENYWNLCTTHVPRKRRWQTDLSTALSRAPALVRSVEMRTRSFSPRPASTMTDDDRTGLPPTPPRHEKRTPTATRNIPSGGGGGGGQRKNNPLAAAAAASRRQVDLMRRSGQYIIIICRGVEYTTGRTRLLVSGNTRESVRRNVATLYRPRFVRT